MGRLPEDGEYYATQTLLASAEINQETGAVREYDRNRRMLYCWPDDKVICHFNYHMDEWTPDDAKRLQFILDTLNATRVKPMERP